MFYQLLCPPLWLVRQPLLVVFLSNKFPLRLTQVVLRPLLQPRTVYVDIICEETVDSVTPADSATPWVLRTVRVRNLLLIVTISDYNIVAQIKVVLLIPGDPLLNPQVTGHV